jgi:hypothetical protein
MAGIPATSDVGYTRKLLKEYAKSSGTGTPNVEEAGYAYGKGQGIQGVEDIKAKTYKDTTSKSLELDRAKLAESVRQSGLNLRSQYKMLDTLKSQNTIATILGGLTTGITALTGWSQLKKQDERDRKYNEILNIMKSTAASKKTMLPGYEDLMSTFNSILSRIKGIGAGSPPLP